MNPGTTTNLTDLAFYAIAGGITLIVLAGLFVLGWKLFKLFKAKDEAERTDEPEQTLSMRAIRNLGRILEEAEKDSNKAGELLCDAETYTLQLVKLIQGIALKAEAMAAEIDTLNNALTAIADRDPLKIAQAGGQVRDEHIRTLMLCKVHNSDYWQDTAMLISAQVGTLQQWEKGYRIFTSNLLGEVSQTKAKAAALTAALELTGTSRPLLQVQAGLSEASGYLQLQRRPGLYKAAKELPAINAGLMLK
jgi:hypothetical protein